MHYYLFLRFQNFQKDTLQIKKGILLFKRIQIIITTLTIVSDWNSFRANWSYSELLRTNPKNVLHLVWYKMDKNQSFFIRLIAFQLEASIRMNPRLVWFGYIRFVSMWSGSETWFGFIRKQIPEWLSIILIRSEWITIPYFCQGTNSNLY